jgi:ADP-dependent NAD(P)H-hydrate dehydratase / NAD(P)H-hydrate epimerase
VRQAWRVAEVRAAEKALMARLPEGTLMARAAAGLARRCALLLADRCGGVYARRVLVLVGSGDNGGDALYAGARLAARGVRVRALLLDAERVHAGGLAALRAAGGATVDAVEPADLVIDGIVGIGGRGGLRPAASAVVDAAAATGAVVVAVDVPSGVQSDTGDVLGPAVRADVTVTFGCLKPGLVVGAGATRAGLVELVDIGLRPHLPQAPALRLPEAADIAAWWPHPEPGSDKYTRGVVGLATGSAEYPGAALLGTAGALAGPTGMVRYAGTARDTVVRTHPSVVTSDSVADSGRVQAWVVGSGLGTDERGRTELAAVLAASVPACIDADALTVLAEDAGLAALLRERPAPVVLTPHDREYARLAGHEPGGDRVAAALDLADQVQATVLLKGDRTVVASPAGEVWVNTTGSPALATAGTGDVLGGLLGSLLAGGLGAVEAAVAAAYLHGLAGREAARRGPVTASDVAMALPAVIAEVLSGT